GLAADLECGIRIGAVDDVAKRPSRREMHQPPAVEIVDVVHTHQQLVLHSLEPVEIHHDGRGNRAAILMASARIAMVFLSSVFCMRFTWPSCSLYHTTATARGSAPRCFFSTSVIPS